MKRLGHRQRNRLVLANIRRLSRPIPARGQRGLWDVAVDLDPIGGA